MPSPITVAEAKSHIHDRSREIAVLDVREHGQYGEGHPFLAVPCPFSRLEATVTRLVPRAGVPLLLVDEGDGVAQGAATLLDLRSSMEFRAGHLRGARWAVRPRLPSMSIDPAQPVLLVGPSDATGPAAHDLIASGVKEVRQVKGGVEDWRRSGLAVGAIPDQPSNGEAIDFLFFVHDRHDGNMEAARRYLAWETGLVAQLDASERAEYRIGPRPFRRK